VKSITVKTIDNYLAELKNSSIDANRIFSFGIEKLNYIKTLQMFQKSTRCTIVNHTPYFLHINFALPTDLRYEYPDMYINKSIEYNGIEFGDITSSSLDKPFDEFLEEEGCLKWETLKDFIEESEDIYKLLEKRNKWIIDNRPDIYNLNLLC